LKHEKKQGIILESSGTFNPLLEEFKSEVNSEDEKKKKKDQEKK
jgi:ribosomal protein S16